MGFFGALFSAFAKTAGFVENGMEKRNSDFHSGYDRGTERASRMSNAELESHLKRAKSDGVSDWGNAGQVRAMADEYKNRKK